MSPEGGAYLEIQAGLTATQFEHLMMPGGEKWSWLEAYGDVAADPTIAHGDDWAAVTSHLDECMDRLAPGSALTEAFDLATEVANVFPATVLCRASGWGALERESRTVSGEGWIIESGTPFPTDTLGADQQFWRELLHDDVSAANDLLHADPQTPPRSYVIGEVWEGLLSRSPSSWARDYHLAVLAHAAGSLAAAQERYSSSLVQQPTAWALRGLARIAKEQEDLPTAALEAGVSAALQLVDGAPRHVRELGRLRLLEARAALAGGAHAQAAHVLATAVVISDVREGETALSDLWLQLYPDEPLPAEYDFRMR